MSVESLLSEWGSSAITLVGAQPRYLQEIDIVATLATQGDEGIKPLIENRELASLEWYGAEMVEVSRF